MRFIGRLSLLIVLLSYLGAGVVLASCPATDPPCGACYDGLRICTHCSQCSGIACPPHAWEQVPDTWETCVGSPVSSCGAGEYACNIDSVPGFCCPYAVPPTDAPPGGGPTDVPTSVPPTAVPPTSVPPTAVPPSPTDIPPTTMPGTPTSTQVPTATRTPTPTATRTPTPTLVPTATPTCAPVCSALVCGVAANSCGGWCTCNECVTCTPACGQVRNCNLNCASTDLGVPTAPIVISPIGTTATPTLVGSSTLVLSWQAVAKVETYDVEVYNIVTGGLAWSQSGIVGTTVTTSALSGQKFRWRVRGVNVTCASYAGGNQIGAWSVWEYITINSGPTVNNVVLENSVGTTVPWDTGNVLQIQDPVFQNTASPNTVIFNIILSDADGWQDITSAQIQWNGDVYNLTLNPGSGTSLTATATINFTSADNVATVQPIYVSVQDNVTSGNAASWVDTGFDFKKWDGQVQVSTGYMYDSTAESSTGAQCPSRVGFTTLAGPEMNFNNVTFTQISPAAVTTFNAINDNSYSGGGVTLTWGETYRVSPNADLAASGVVSCWTDPNTGAIHCGVQNTLDESVVDPYAAVPSIQVDFSAILSQDPWFQASGGAVQAGSSIVDMVPLTCALNASCVAAITKESVAGSSDNGLVSGRSGIANNSGCSLQESQCNYGSPNNWYKTGVSLYTGDKYNYKYFYDKYFVGLGLGHTLPANSTMSTVKAMGGTGVYMVNGDFSIDTDNTVPTGSFLMIIAKGSINIATSVNQTQGIITADNGIAATGTSATQLVISGSLYSSSNSGNIRLSRGFTNTSLNNATPAVVVQYRPDLLFNMPGLMLKVLSGWKQY